MAVSPVKPTLSGPYLDELPQLARNTLRATRCSLWISVGVNTGALIAGGGLLVAVTISGEWWRAVIEALGGIGIIVTALVRNPLRTINYITPRLVQVQVAYLTFVAQVSVLEDASCTLTAQRRFELLKEARSDCVNTLQYCFTEPRTS